MNELSEFLENFNISKSDFESTGLVWKNLLKIKDDYEVFKLELIPSANYLIESFHNVKKIHSVRFRIKNSYHVLEKIIRKKLEDPARIIDINNYKEEITDLIGLRALHLFKEDWIHIHHFITENWNLKKEPIAYFRKGDSADYVEIFKKYGCNVKEHPFGYRSVHYLVETSPNKTTYIFEVQVRTIFEEGWSEIDHTIRYPYDKNNRLLNQFLVIFNRLSGSADEMGSYVQYLKKELENKEKEFRKAVDKKVQIIEDMKGKIKKLELKPKVALQWEHELNEILEIKIPDLSNIEFPDLSNIEFPDLSNIAIPDLSNIKLPKDLSIQLPKIDLDAKPKKPKKKPDKKKKK